MKKRIPAWAKRTALGGVLSAAAFAAAVRWIPFPDEKLARLDASAVLADRNGEPLRVKLAAGGFDCRPGYLPAPEHWIAKAMVASEDRRFWTHPGVDIWALARAVAQNLAGGRRVSGASTISTQVIRLAEPRRRTLATKAIEAFRALQLEARFSKDEILGIWLTLAPQGGNIEGIRAGSLSWFGRQATQLDAAEAERILREIRELTTE